MNQPRDHLELIDGIVFLAYFPTVYDDMDEPLSLGPVDDGPEWLASLGPEPKWFLTECGWLLDGWLDAQAFAEGCEATARNSYRYGIGA